MNDRYQSLFNKNSQKGFTMIEIMVVVVIIGILAAFVGPKIIGNPEKARITQAKSTIKGLDSALKMYRLDNGFYPTSEQGLKALVTPPENGRIPQNFQKGGYMERIPKDPWQGDFVYRCCPGQNGDFDLFSYGPDQSEGGGDDVTNWEKTEG